MGTNDLNQHIIQNNYSMNLDKCLNRYDNCVEHINDILLTKHSSKNFMIQDYMLRQPVIVQFYIYIDNDIYTRSKKYYLYRFFQKDLLINGDDELEEDLKLYAQVYAWEYLEGWYLAILYERFVEVEVFIKNKKIIVRLQDPLEIETLRVLEIPETLLKKLKANLVLAMLAK